MTNRTTTQELIEGWDQEKLRELSVAIIGTDNISQILLCNLTGIEVGEIVIIDNKRVGREQDTLPTREQKGQSKALRLREIVQVMNPNIYIRSYHSIPHEYMLSDSQIIVDTTNNPHTKKKCKIYSDKKQRTFISAVSSDIEASISDFGKDKQSSKLERILKKSKRPIPRIQTEFLHLTQGIIPSGIIAGIIADEIRKNAFKVRAYETILDYELRYSSSRYRSSNSIDLVKAIRNTQKRNKILIVGAGALGNYASIAACSSGIEYIDICDDDTIEESNKNRQPLFTLNQTESGKKSEVCAKELKAINPNASINSLCRKVSENDYSAKEIVDARYDLIVSCVDNAKARIYLNQVCRKHSIPLIDGGTTPYDGQVTVFYPGKTACLTCQAPIVSNEQPTISSGNSNSCNADHHDPSVVYTNCIIGFSMISEAMNILRSNGSNILNGQFMYNSLDRERIGIRKSTKNSCKHENE